MSACRRSFVDLDAAIRANDKEKTRQIALNNSLNEQKSAKAIFKK